MVLLLTISLFFLFYAGLVLYYGISWIHVPIEAAGQPEQNIRFSIIIPARNEEKHLPSLLQALAGQDYPKENYEIIVVDDHSTDGTAAVAAEYPGVRCIPTGTDEKNSFKKKAIEEGIAAARFEWIAGSDADCIPGSNWLKILADTIDKKNPVFIAAPVQFVTTISVLGIFQEMDFMILQAITGVVVSKKQMSMCNGANIAYKKSAFQAVDGFKGIDQIASGDDMLLMHKIWMAFPDEVVYLKNEEAIVKTEGAMNWRDFFRQRIRWASKARNYQDKRIFPVLLLVYLFNLSFPALFIASIICSWYWQWLCGLWLAKTLVEWPLFMNAAKFFRRRALIPLFFFFQPLHIIYTILSGFFGQFGKYEWKGRMVR